MSGSAAPAAPAAARSIPATTYAAHRVAGTVRLRGGGGRVLANCGAKLRAAGPGSVTIDGKAYRGALEVVPTKSDAGSLNAINAVAVDQYAKGVIANESPPSWPMAELEAQAVAVRSVALTTSVDGNGFDLYDDTRSQVYEGIDSETARTNAAAAATRGQVVLYHGEIAQTFFSACSGGHTESVQNVFFGPPVPYLVGVPDPYDGACPLHSWTLRFSGAEISARLGGYLDGRLKQIVVTKRGASPRIVWARLVGTGGTTKIRGDQLQSALGAYDRWMTFSKVVGGKAAPAPGSGGGAPGGGAAGGVSQPSGIGLDRDAVVGLAHPELVGGAGGEPQLAGRLRRAFDGQLEVGDRAVDRVVLGPVGVGVDPADEVLARRRDAAADDDVLAGQDEGAFARRLLHRGGADLPEAAEPVASRRRGRASRRGPRGVVQEPSLIRAAPASK